LTSILLLFAAGLLVGRDPTYLLNASPSADERRSNVRPTTFGAGRMAFWASVLSARRRR